MAGGVRGVGHAWLGGLHGRGHVWWGACMGGGVHGRGAMHGRGNMHGRGACVAGGCAWQGGMHGRGDMRCRGRRVWQGEACMEGGHAWQGCVCDGGACVPWQIPLDTVNERAVRILLECILVGSEFYGKNFGQHKKIICTATSTCFVQNVKFIRIKTLHENIYSSAKVK